MRVLVVDDDTTVGTLIIQSLSDQHEVVHITEGREGLVAYDSFQPDMVFLDLRLPDISGVEVLEEMQQSSHTCSIVVVTAYDDEAVLLRDRVTNVMIKPIDLHMVLDVTTQVLCELNSRLEEKLEEES